MKQRATRVLLPILLLAASASLSCDLWNRLFPGDYLVRKHIKAEEGGVVETPDGKLRLEIPPWALWEDATVTVSMFDSAPNLPPFSLISARGGCYEVSLGASRLVDSAKIRLAYTNESRQEECVLAVACHDTALGGWELLDSDQDSSAFYVGASIGHSSAFQLAELGKLLETPNVRLQVPYYYSGVVNWCIPTSMAMFASSYGYDWEYYQAAAARGMAPGEGTLPYFLDRVFMNARGMPDVGQTVLAAPLLKFVIAAAMHDGMPLVMHDRAQDAHTVVVVGCDDERVHFHDPTGWYGRLHVCVSMTWSEFEAKSYVRVANYATGLAQLPEKRSRGAIGLHKDSLLFVSDGDDTLHWQADGRRQLGYHYVQRGARERRENGVLGYVAKLSDEIRVAQYQVANVTQGIRSFRCSVDVYDHDVAATVAWPYAEDLHDLAPRSITTLQVITPADPFRLSGLTEEHDYSLRAFLLSDGILQDSVSIRFRVESGDNRPPGSPSIPDGPPIGQLGLLYHFSTSATDPDGDDVAYRFSWGDGNISDWTQFGASGGVDSMAHSWAVAGIHDVRAQASDVHGVLSEWSQPFEFTIPDPGTGMVMYLSFDEGSGTACHDLSGYGNHGEVHGASWVSGVSGPALFFDGRDDYVEVPHSTSLGITSDLTVCAWVRFRAGGTINPRILSKLAHNGGSYEPGYEILTDGTSRKRKWRFRASVEREALATQGEINENEWYFLVGVRKADSMYIYQDGTLVGSRRAATGLSPGTLPLCIGRKSVPGYDQFKGGIDEVRIYSRALSEAEIRDLYSALKD